MVAKKSDNLERCQNPGEIEAWSARHCAVHWDDSLKWNRYVSSLIPGREQQRSIWLVPQGHLNMYISTAEQGCFYITPKEFQRIVIPA